jgi:hypothetical protein
MLITGQGRGNGDEVIETRGRWPESLGTTGIDIIAVRAVVYS